MQDPRHSGRGSGLGVTVVVTGLWVGLGFGLLSWKGERTSKRKMIIRV